MRKNMKLNKPKVSVILPSLNVIPYIKECIESVIKQTLKDIEIICVDGGSTDGTLEILEEYSYIDSRIKLIKSDVQSYGYQMNLGMNYANGEYIGIVETDDYIDETMYETLYEYSDNGSADIIKSSFYHLKGTEITVDTSKQNLPTTKFSAYDDPNILKSHPSIWAAIYKKSFLEKNNISFMEAPGGGWVDNPFLFETLLSTNNIIYIDKPFYYYRELNPTSSSNNISDYTLPMRRMLNMFDILEKYGCNDKNILSTFYIRVFWHIGELINEPEKNNQETEVLYYINKVLQKLDENIVKENFGFKEQQIYYKYSSPLYLAKLNKMETLHLFKDELKDLMKEYDFLYSNLHNDGQFIEKQLTEKRIKHLSKKIFSESSNLKNIHIAYVLNGFPIHSETFIVNEVKWLKENGYNITVFIREEPYKPTEIDFDVDILKFNNIHELEELLIKYEIDLIHTHFVYPICTQITFPVAEKLKIPFTVFAHAYDIFIYENNKLNKVDEISNSQFCIGIFTLSEFHKNYLINNGANEDKIIITKQATNYTLSNIKPKNDKIKKIISISRFVEKKGLDTLISAAKLLENENFEFSIYGFGELEKELQKQITDMDCSNISIKGELPPNQVIQKLKEHDLLVSSCKKAKNGDMDGFPTIIFEGMAVGIPVLTTNISAIPEIIKEGKNGFIIEADNAKLLSEKIKYISDLPAEKLFEIEKQAQEDVKNTSSVEKTMEKYIDTIKKWEN